MRSIPFQMNPVTENKRIDTQYYVEGYATTFKPYVLYRDYAGNDVYELIERSSLDNADMSDIIFNKPDRTNTRRIVHGINKSTGF